MDIVREYEALMKAVESSYPETVGIIEEHSDMLEKYYKFLRAGRPRPKIFTSDGTELVADRKELSTKLANILAQNQSDIPCQNRPQTF